MKVAVVGATGAVGETILRVLEEREIAIESLEPFASREHADPVRFRGNALRVRAASEPALRGFDVVFFAGGEDASEKLAPGLIENGSVVIDNSSTFRMRDDVPLIVPGVNSRALRAEHRLFPVANCTAIVLCSALRPIRDAAGLRQVHVATYQAASGAGRAGLDELLAGERAVACGQAEPEAAIFRATAYAQRGTAGRCFRRCGMDRRGAQNLRGDAQDARSAGARRLPRRPSEFRCEPHIAWLSFCKTERETSVESTGRGLRRCAGYRLSSRRNRDTARGRRNE